MHTFFVCRAYFFLAHISEPIPYTLPENAAQIFRLKMTQRDYQDFRNDAIAHNNEPPNTWNKVRDYCKTKCRPIIHSNEEMTWCSVQSALDHQLGRQVEISPSLEASIVARHVTGHDLSFVFQWGGDGCSDNSEYRNKKDKSQKTMVASVLQTIALRAELQVGDSVLSDDLWQNQCVNSWMSVVPLKYVFQEESIGTHSMLKIEKKILHT